MTHILHIIAIAEHPDLTSAAKAIGCYQTRHADVSGMVTTDTAGHPLHIPAGLGRALGMPEPTARRALSQLHDFGLVEWHRHRAPQGKGVAGTVRVILPSVTNS